MVVGQAYKAARINQGDYAPASGALLRWYEKTNNGRNKSFCDY